MPLFVPLPASFVYLAASVAVDYNAANTDHPLTVTLPSGITRYRIQSLIAINTGTTASLTTARAGLFTSAAGGGTALVADQVLTAITSNAADTPGNMIQFTVNTTWLTDTTLFFRVSTAQGAAASGTAYLSIQPLP